jgi:choline monooxygenase
MYDASALRERMVAELQSAIQRNVSIPGYWYGDRDVSEFEQEYVIRRSWQPVGSIAGLANPGDYLTATVAGVPVLLLRGKDGELKGFLNMCRHRGHLVAKDTGSAQLLVCKYHGWTYRIDGTLQKAPRAEREAAFDPAAHSLVPVRVGAWGELGLVNLAPEGTAFSDQFATLMAVAEEHGVGIACSAYRRTLVWEQACNWKTFMDNTADCYHCRLVHPNMGKTHKTDPDDYVNESHESFALHISYARQEQANMPSWKACGVWPNWTLQGMEGRVSNVRVLEILGPDRIRVRTDFFAPSIIPQEEVDEAVDWYHKLVYGEDRIVCEGVARNIAGGRFQEGPIFLESEKVMQDFQWKYLKHLQALSV